MPVNSEIFRIYRHLFYGSPLNYLKNEEESLGKDREIRVGHKHEIFELTGADGNRRVCCTKI